MRSPRLIVLLPVLTALAGVAPAAAAGAGVPAAPAVKPLLKVAARALPAEARERLTGRAAQKLLAAGLPGAAGCNAAPRTTRKGGLTLTVTRSACVRWEPCLTTDAAARGRQVHRTTARMASGKHWIEADVTTTAQLTADPGKQAFTSVAGTVATSRASQGKARRYTDGAGLGAAASRALTADGAVDEASRRALACAAGTRPPESTPSPTPIPPSPGADTLPRFSAEINGFQEYVWSFTSHDDANANTDSSCVTRVSASGEHVRMFHTIEPGPRAKAVLRDGELHITDEPRLQMEDTRTGDEVTSRTGRAPGCNGVAHADQTGCDTWYARPQPDASWDEGYVRLDPGTYQTDGRGPCPIYEPTYGAHALRDTYLTEGGVRPDLSALRDPAQQTVVLHHESTITGHEDCLSEDGPGCTDSNSLKQTYATDATLTGSWTITLRRL